MKTKYAIQLATDPTIVTLTLPNILKSDLSSALKDATLTLALSSQSTYVLPGLDGFTITVTSDHRLDDLILALRHLNSRDRFCAVTALSHGVACLFNYTNPTAPSPHLIHTFTTLIA